MAQGPHYKAHVVGLSGAAQGPQADRHSDQAGQSKGLEVASQSQGQGKSQTSAWVSTVLYNTGMVSGHGRQTSGICHELPFSCPTVKVRGSGFDFFFPSLFFMSLS